VRVRVLGDDESEEDHGARSYHAAFAAMQACGAQVEFVRSTGIMHLKAFLIDVGTSNEQLVIGSTNQSTSDFEKSHNHMVFVRGAPEFTNAYQREFDQLFGRCQGNTSRARVCDQCTPACVANVNPEGPWTLASRDMGDIGLSVHFSPSDDALAVLRGPMSERRFSIDRNGDQHCVRTEVSNTSHGCFPSRAAAMAARDTAATQPDPACLAPGANCVCRISGAGFACEYCGGPDGSDWGVMGNAQRQVLTSVFANTDQCFALAVGRAAQRGVAAFAIYDQSNSFQPESRDDYLAGMGVTVLIANWANGAFEGRNHNKLVVVDDVVFDGSMNLSGNGADQNNENSVVYRSPELARQFSEYIFAESALLERRGVTPLNPAISRCQDLVDNDGDGTIDAADPDCAAGDHRDEPNVLR